MKELNDRAALDSTNGSSPYSESRSIALERPDHRPNGGLEGATIDTSRYMDRMADLDLTEEEAQEFLGVLFQLLWPLAYYGRPLSPTALVSLVTADPTLTNNSPAAVPAGNRRRLENAHD